MRQLKYLLFFSTLLINACSSSFEEKVLNCVDRQLDLYPESRLQDIYKNFFQDKFGPGHLINDLSAAEDYLKQELSSYTESHEPLTESIGWEGNFYRVSLDMVKDQHIPYEIFLEAFVESANSTEMPSIEEWKKEWNKIVKIIDRIHLDLPDYEKDKIMIQQLLNDGKCAVHHSEAFSKAYDPHYRIIRKDIFKEKIEPLIEKRQ